MSKISPGAASRRWPLHCRRPLASSLLPPAGRSLTDSRPLLETSAVLVNGLAASPIRDFLAYHYANGVPTLCQSNSRRGQPNLDENSRIAAILFDEWVSQNYQYCRGSQQLGISASSLCEGEAVYRPGT